MIDRARIKTATIPEWVALDLLRDIDSAIRHRDAGSLRNFAAEAALSGLDQEAARCAHGTSPRGSTDAASVRFR